jgi:hypothetical protein
MQSPEKSLKASSVYLRQGFSGSWGAKLHLGGASMRGYDFPPVVKFLRIMRRFCLELGKETDHQVGADAASTT